MRRSIFILVIVILLLGSQTSAQTKDQIELVGTVYDQLGAVIPDTMITARRADGKTFETKTNDEGFYRLSVDFIRYGSAGKVKTAVYEITAECPKLGFKKQIVLNNFRVVPSFRGIMNLDLVLETPPTEAIFCPGGSYD